jgi:hypothetical protein
VDNPTTCDGATIKVTSTTATGTFGKERGRQHLDLHSDEAIFG